MLHLTSIERAESEAEDAVLKTAYKYAEKARELREHPEIAGALLPSYHAAMGDLLGAAADLTI